MTHQTQRSARLPQRSELLATVATLARRQAILERCSQEAVASAHRICHVSRLQRARRRVAADRRWGRDPGPLAWFAIEGMIDDRVVRAIWTEGQLCCDRALESRARLLVDLGAEFGSDDLPRRYRASLQAPPAAVLLTLIRACDLPMAIDVDLGASS